MFGVKANGKIKKSCTPCLKRIQARRAEKRVVKYKNTKHIRVREAKILKRFYTLPAEAIQLIWEFDNTYHEIFKQSLLKICLTSIPCSAYTWKPKYQRLFGDDEYYVEEMGVKNHVRVTSLYQRYDMLCNSLLLTWPKVRTMMEAVTDLDLCDDVHCAIDLQDHMRTASMQWWLEE
jgi:hypothetical protein